MNEVRPQLDELLFSSVEGVLVESVEVTDTSVRGEARTTVRRAACPGCGCWSGRIRHTPAADRRRQRVLDVLHAEPDRQWHTLDLARRLGDITLGTMHRQLDSSTDAP
ncbi:hypothetical protein O1Q96_23405 [Streptomyces sp. Qhu-G9]|uniref:hypothetical protein n=1 Tax=Streptomyces sp. Qhu-G9 TaxID=3452799 RepID=UPI0022ABFE9D|nr:hypothetical protein [Streptomyces aurantiacus]WAU82437.1 hypothetical protein O1Q96_23405 [Streptomyces aurantiacus]